VQVVVAVRSAGSLLTVSWKTMSPVVRLVRVNWKLNGMSTWLLVVTNAGVHIARSERPTTTTV
jgi:hypothetical protein